MEARMKNPALVIPEALDALIALSKSTASAGLPERTIALIHLRASQINSCSVCVDMHWRELRRAGASDEQLMNVAAWREAPYFTDKERAVLALTEAATRLADKADAVPDEVWRDAARHYNERELAALVLQIAVINAFNRINAATRQIARGEIRVPERATLKA